MLSTNSNYWSGDRLSPGAVAVLSLVDGADRIAPARPILAAGTVAGDYVELDCRQIADFLEKHADRQLVSCNAAPLHWLLYDCLNEVQAPERIGRILWAFSRECRLCDVGLLDQRLRLARDGMCVAVRKLEQLAEAFCNRELKGTQDRIAALLQIHQALAAEAKEFTANIDRLPSSELPDIPQGPEIRFTVDRGLEIDEGWQPGESRWDPIELAELQWKQRRWARFRSNESRFGPLGHGVDVQGAIALQQVVRTGRRSDPEAAAELGSRCREVLRWSSGILHNNERARRGFRWDGCQVRLDAGGWIEKKEGKLRLWLSEMWDRCRDLHGAPRKRPVDRTGGISLVPDHWGILPLCNQLLRAWNDLEAAAATLRFLNQAETARPGYRVIPSIGSSNPSLQALARIRRGLFVPGGDHVFCVGRLSDLELRCHGAIAAAGNDPTDRIAAAYVDGRDPTEELATRLRASEPASPESAHPYPWLTELGAARQHAVASLLLRATGRRLSPSETGQLLSSELGIENVHAGDLQRLLVGLLGEPIGHGISPEWGGFLDEGTVDAVAEKLNMSSREFIRQFPMNDLLNWTTAPMSLRNVLLGEAQGRRAWQTIKALAVGSPFEQEIQRLEPGQAAYEFFMARNPISPVTGRVGCRVYWPERQSTEGLGLADEVMAMIAYELVAAGLRLVAVVADEIVLEVADNAPDAIQAAALVEGVVRSALGPMGRNCIRWDQAKQW